MSPDRPSVPAPTAPPPASRRRALAVVAMALAVLVVAAACGGDDSGSKAAPGAAQPFEFSGNAATLDGQAIPAQVLADQIDAFRKAPEAAQTALHVDQLY